MAQLITARLSRTDAQPWGFRLQGGKDFGTPLTIQKVSRFIDFFILFMGFLFAFFLELQATETLSGKQDLRKDEKGS